MQEARDRHLEHDRPERFEQGAELRRALEVRAPTDPDVDGVLDREHVSAVERGRRLDPRRRQPERTDRRLGPVDLGESRRSTRPRREPEAAVDDERVLDENRVGAVLRS